MVIDMTKEEIIESTTAILLGLSLDYFGWTLQIILGS